MTKQKPSHRKALRSAAAKKGWETRRKAQLDANAALALALQRHREARQASMRPFMRSAEPVQSYWKQDELTWGRPIGIRNRVRAFLHRLWSKLVGR